LAFAGDPLFTVDFEAMGNAGAVPADWRYFGASRTVGPSAEKAHGGKYSLKLVDTSPKEAVGLRSAPIPVVPGRSYLVEFWYFAESGNREAVYLEFWDAKGTRIAANSHGAQAKGKWVRQRVRNAAPAGAVSLRIHFNSYSTNVATGYFDDVRVYASTNPGALQRRPYPPAPVAHPCGLYKQADVDRAKANIERHEWARRVLRSFRSAADFWLKVPDDKLSYWIPDLTPFRVVDCPKCGAGWRFAWGGGYDRLVCKKCGFAWPDPDYPESESATFPDPVGGSQTIPYYKGKPSTVYGASQKEVYRLSGHLRYRRLGKLGNVGALGKVYALTGERKYAERTRAVLLRLAEVYPHYLPHDWNRIYPDYRNLQSGKLCGWKLTDASRFIQLATAYDLTYNSGVYSDEDKVRIEEGCFREFARLMTATSPRGCCINDGPTAMGGGALAGLMLGSHETIAWAVEPPDGFLGFLEEYFVRDGHWYEASPSYEGMSVNPLYVVPEALRGYSDPPNYDEPGRYDGLDLFQQPLLRKLLIAGAYEIMPDGAMPPTNDSVWQARFPRRRAEMQAYWYPDATSQGIMAWQFGGSEEVSGDEYALFRRDPDFAPEEHEALNLSARSVVRPGVGWGILRTGDSRTDAAVFLDYGPRGSGHGHPDRLNIIYYDYGAELVTDMGYLGWGHPNHPWIRATASHNEVIVDGKPQANGGGELEAFAGDGAIQGMIASTPAAYPGVVETYRRHLVMVDHGPGRRYLVDLFEVKGGTEHQYAFHGDGETFAAEGLAFHPLDAKDLGDPATGYQFMEGVEQASTDDTVSCRWTSDPDTGLGVRLRLLGAPGTRLVHAEANGLRDHGAPFAKVRMHPILVRRQGPENRFLAVIDAVKGRAVSTDAIRRLDTRTSAGWAEAVEIRAGDRTDVVVFASSEAATAGVTVPEHSGVTFHSRLGYASFRAGMADHLWLLGGTQAAAGELALACPPAVACRLVQAEDATVVLDQPVPPGLRAKDQYLLVAGRSNGAYRLAGAAGATLRLADDPILDVAAGDSATIVPWAAISRVAPHAFRLLGDIQSAHLPANAKRRRFLRVPGQPWRELAGALDPAHLPGRDVLLASADTDLAADTEAPTIPAVHDDHGLALTGADLGFRPRLRRLIFAVRDDAPVRAGLARATLIGDRSGDLPVVLKQEGERMVCTLPSPLPEDTFALSFEIGDAALNRTVRTLAFNTTGYVLPCRDMAVVASSGATVKYFPDLDTRFYRGTKPGDWVEFGFAAPAAGRYAVRLVYTRFGSYGTARASLDGTPCGQAVDLYGPKLAAGAGTAELGIRTLAAGDHRLRLAVTGRNPASNGYFLGVCRLVLKPAD
jgi:hypothetical protein